MGFGMAIIRLLILLPLMMYTFVLMSLCVTPNTELPYLRPRGTTCQAGYVSSAGAGECLPCQPGTFTTATWTTSSYLLFDIGQGLNNCNRLQPVPSRYGYRLYYWSFASLEGLRCSVPKTSNPSPRFCSFPARARASQCFSHVTVFESRCWVCSILGARERLQSAMFWDARHAHRQGFRPELSGCSEPST